MRLMIQHSSPGPTDTTVWLISLILGTVSDTAKEQRSYYFQQATHFRVEAADFLLHTAPCFSDALELHNPGTALQLQLSI